MPLTKTGEILLQKEAAMPGEKIQKAIWGLLKQAPKAKKPTIGFFEGTYKATKGIGKGVASGLGGAGRAIARRPGIGLPVAGVGLYGASKAKENFNKNWTHTDPHTNATYQESALPYGIPGVKGMGLKYRNDKVKDFYKNQNMLY